MNVSIATNQVEKLLPLDTTLSVSHYGTGRVVSVEKTAKNGTFQLILALTKAQRGEVRQIILFSVKNSANDRLIDHWRVSNTDIEVEIERIDRN